METTEVLHQRLSFQLIASIKLRRASEHLGARRMKLLVSLHFSRFVRWRDKSRHQALIPVFIHRFHA